MVELLRVAGSGLGALQLTLSLRVFEVLTL
jgi:hypothetical protein